MLSTTSATKSTSRLFFTTKNSWEIVAVGEDQAPVDKHRIDPATLHLGWPVCKQQWEASNRGNDWYTEKAAWRTHSAVQVQSEKGQALHWHRWYANNAWQMVQNVYALQMVNTCSMSFGDPASGCSRCNAVLTIPSTSTWRHQLVSLCLWREFLWRWLLTEISDTGMRRRCLQSSSSWGLYDLTSVDYLNPYAWFFRNGLSPKVSSISEGEDYLLPWS